MSSVIMVRVMAKVRVRVWIMVRVITARKPDVIAASKSKACSLL
jgi:hypothetical protein